jgi:hypothetical protein
MLYILFCTYSTLLIYRFDCEWNMDSPIRNVTTEDKINTC